MRDSCLSKFRRFLTCDPSGSGVNVFNRPTSSQFPQTSSWAEALSMSAAIATSHLDDIPGPDCDFYSQDKRT